MGEHCQIKQEIHYSVSYILRTFKCSKLQHMNRKNFLQKTAMASSAFVLSSSILMAKTNANKVKIVLIGTGLRGQNHLDLLLRREDVDLTAICDINDKMLSAAKAMIEKAGKKMPKIYTGNTQAWKEMIVKEKPDGVVIATPWELHKEMIIESLQAGIKYVATEVMLGITLQDHWDVVKAAEQYKGQVMMLENVCYRRDVMAALNMVRQGLFGEIVHLQGGYQHDLREVKFNDGVRPYGGGVEFGEKGIFRSFLENHAFCV
jgi:predicted dehydrogenase